MSVITDDSDCEDNKDFGNGEGIHDIDLFAETNVVEYHEEDTKQAFKELNEDESVNKEKLASIKEKFEKMTEKYLWQKRQETKLIEKAKEFQKIQEKQLKRLADNNTIPIGALQDTEIKGQLTMLKGLFGKLFNSEFVSDRNQKTIISLEEEKKNLVKKFKKLADSEDLNRSKDLIEMRTRDLKRHVETLKQNLEEVEGFLMENIETKNNNETNLQNMNSKLLSLQALVEEKCFEANSQKKEYEKFLNSHRELEKYLAEGKTEIQHLSWLIIKYNDDCNSIKQENSLLVRNIALLNDEIEENEKKNELTKKNINETRARTEDCQKKSQEVENQIMEVNEEKKKYFEEVNIMKKEVKKQEKVLRNSISLAQSSKTAYQFTLRNCERLIQMCKAEEIQKDAGFGMFKAITKEQMRIKKDKENEQSSKSDKDLQLSQALMAHNEDLLHQLSQHRAHLLSVLKMMHRKLDEKDNKAQDLMRRQQENEDLEEELVEVKLQIDEEKQKLSRIKNSMEKLSDRYYSMRHERNRAKKHIEEGEDLVMGVKKKLLLKESQKDALIRAVQNKNMLLKKQRALHTIFFMAIDKLRNKVSGEKLGSLEIDEKYKEKKFVLENSLKEKTEKMEEKKKIKDNIEKEISFVKKREQVLMANKSHLMEFSQRSVTLENSYIENKIKKSLKEDEIKSLLISKCDVERILKILEDKLEKKKKLEKKLINSQIDFSKIQDRIIDLETQLTRAYDREFPQDEHRHARILGGPPFDRGAMEKKEKEIARSLKKKEKEMNEKVLILDKLEEKTAITLEKLRNGKEECIELNRQIHSLKYSVRKRTYKSMALMSELSLVKNQIIKLGDFLSDYRMQVTSSSDKLSLGLAPSILTGKRWERILRNIQERKDMTTEQESDSEASY